MAVSRQAVQDRFGGSEVLHVRHLPEPHAGRGEIRVRVSAAGLNPVDVKMSENAEVAAIFGITVPTGFGHDFAGTVDEVGEGVTGFALGDRVFGGARGRAVAEHLVISAAAGVLEHTPVGLDDVRASALAITARTASAVVEAVNLSGSDTFLVGGASGGVGVLTIQLAARVGARVVGTASDRHHAHLHKLGIDEVVTHGPGLVERILAVAPHGITAAADLHGTDTVQTALQLSVPPNRIAAISAGPTPPGGAIATSGRDSAPGALSHIANLVASGDIDLPIAATYRFDSIRQAVEMQRRGQQFGKIVVNLSEPH
ncbi:NADP-dependent oxidoreductase [Paenarthrobacter sp. NCHU4564]|uniref:NADP-dependent oxidoreductase n=1 Tax=Paenarthrobacter sp. NCHU4564 TaxID=3451353 RepID=UPI003F9CB1CD